MHLLCSFYDHFPMYIQPSQTASVLYLKFFTVIYFI